MIGTDAMEVNLMENVTSSGNNPINMLEDPTLISALLGGTSGEATIRDVAGNSEGDNEEEDDEIIREIDIFISPELAASMHLVQFPLQPASHTVNALHKKSIRPPPPPIPASAQIRPQHSLLELMYDIPSSSFASQRQIPEVLNLKQRTLSSQNIPLVTHMAMGLFDSTGNKIDLVPLHRVMQMRPNFKHVDALFDDGEDEVAKLEEQKKKDSASKPIMFKRPENERAVMAKRSSYAFKKANEDGEEWIELDVHGPGSLERKAVMKKAYCSRAARDKSLRFMKAGQAGGNGGYVRSLNYLPTSVAADAVEDFVISEEMNVNDVNVDENGNVTVPNWMKDLSAKVATLLQGRQGVPISYPVVRSRFNSSISDYALIQALSATSVLVRGNFVLKSNFMALSGPVVKTRDVILLLMIKYGVIQRELLVKAYEKCGEDSIVITRDVINSLLTLLARKTLNGMEMKLDDDPTFEIEFTEVARLHDLYWEKKKTELGMYINLYDGMYDSTMDDSSTATASLRLRQYWPDKRNAQIH